MHLHLCCTLFINLWVSFIAMLVAWEKMVIIEDIIVYCAHALAFRFFSFSASIGHLSVTTVST